MNSETLNSPNPERWFTPAQHCTPSKESWQCSFLLVRRAADWKAPYTLDIGLQTDRSSLGLAWWLARSFATTDKTSRSTKTSDSDEARLALARDIAAAPVLVEPLGQVRR